MKLPYILLPLTLSLGFLSPLQAAPPEPAAEANYRAMKYGYFVHYVWGGDAYAVTVNKDGDRTTSGKPMQVDEWKVIGKPAP